MAWRYFWRYVSRALGALGGGPYFALLGLLGYTWGDQFSWPISLGAVVLVSIYEVTSARAAQRGLQARISSTVDCFRTCVVKETPGMSLDVDVTYFIGLFPWQDREERRYSISTGDEAGLAKHIFLGQQGRTAPSEGPYTFAGLQRLGIEVERAEGGTPLDPEQANVCFVPYQIDQDRLYLVLGFNPPIEPHSSRDVVIRLRRRELWNQLRLTGQDGKCAFTTAEIPTKSLKIHVVIPKSSIPHEQLRIVRHAHFREIGTVRHVYSTRHGGPEVIWEIDAPTQSIRYEYEVLCAGLGKTSARIGQAFYRFRRRFVRPRAKSSAEE